MPGEPDKPDWCKNDPPISYFSVQSMVWPADGEQSTKGIDILIYSSIGQLPYVISSAPTLGEADLVGSASAAACMEWKHRVDIDMDICYLVFSNLTPAEEPFSTNSLPSWIFKACYVLCGSSWPAELRATSLPWTSHIIIMIVDHLASMTEVHNYVTFSLCPVYKGTLNMQSNPLMDVLVCCQGIKVI